MYLPREVSVAQVIERIGGMQGIETVLDNRAACERFELPNDRVGDIVDVSQPLERAAAGNLFTLVVVEALGHVGGDESGRDRIDVHAEAADFARQRPREPDHRRFGSAVH